MCVCGGVGGSLELCFGSSCKQCGHYVRFQLRQYFKKKGGGGNYAVLKHIRRLPKMSRVFDNHSIQSVGFALIYIKENQDKLPTLFLLLKLHKRPYEACFIANSSSCTTTVQFCDRTVSDFNNRHKFLNAKLLKQGYRYRKLRKRFLSFIIAILN